MREALRMLVVIAAPLGLNENEVLHFTREEDLILAATAQARKAGRLRLEFSPNGSLETLEEKLREFQPHLLHFVGHGVFVDSQDRGLLLMETSDGHKRQVWNAEFVESLLKMDANYGVSSCRPASRPWRARTEGFTDLAPCLLEAGIPVVAAMQHSVLNISAMNFGSAFYKGIADGKFVEEAFTEARQAMQTGSPNGVDFATPVLYLSDPDCLKVDLPDREVDETPLDLSGVEKTQNFVGRTAEMRELLTRLDPDNGTWRAAVIYAIGGMGKTALAARLAERMAPDLDGVVSLRMSPTSTAQAVLDQLGDFLIAHNARYNRTGIHELQQARSQASDLKTRLGILAQILRDLRLLVIFDNCEDILPEGKAVSRETTRAETAASIDPGLLPLIAALVGSVDGPSRFLFTSRVDFPVVEPGRLQDAIGHLPLSELGFREAVYLMETLPPLDGLPVAVLNQLNAEPVSSPQATSMRDVYARLGGHPFRLGLFARHAARTSVGQVLDDLGRVDREMLEFTLLERAVTFLPERASWLLGRAAVYEEAVPIEGLAYLLGDEKDVMPVVESEVQALLAWGLMAFDPDYEAYHLHSMVRDWGKGKWSEGERKDLLRRAAEYWQRCRAG